MGYGICLVMTHRMDFRIAPEYGSRVTSVHSLFFSVKEKEEAYSLTQYSKQKRCLIKKHD